MTEKLTGGFTLPGEAGFEDLTLQLAKKWGADVIVTATEPSCRMRSSIPVTVFTQRSALSAITTRGRRSIRSIYSSLF